MAKKLKIGILVVLIFGAAAWIFPQFNFFSGIGIIKGGEANLSWEVKDDAKSYKVYWGESPRNADCPPGGYENNLDVGKVGEYKVEKLESGKTYYFSVTAIGEGEKESCFSPETQKQIPSGWRIF